MVKRNLPPITGKCEICTINLFGSPPKPIVWPCGIHRTELGKEKKIPKCPYETTEEFDIYMKKYKEKNKPLGPTGEAET